MQILAFFTNNGVPATGLSPTIRIRNVDTTVLVVTDAAMSETGDGHYSYDFTGYDPTEDYAIRCDGGVTLRNTDRYKYAGNDNYYDDIDRVIDTNTYILGISGDIGEVNTNVLNISASASVDPVGIANEVWRHQVSAGDPGSAEDTLLGVVSDITNLNTNVLAVSAGVLVNQAYLQRIIGLVHENIYIDNPVYDGDNNLTSARLRIYSTPASVGTANNVIGTYTITSPGDGAGRFTYWQQVSS